MGQIARFEDAIASATEHHGRSGDLGVLTAVLGDDEM